MPKCTRTINILGIKAKSGNTGHNPLSVFLQPARSIPTIPEYEIEHIYENFIEPYITHGPYKLPHFTKFQRVINIVDEKLNTVVNKPTYKLNLFKGILDALVRGRSIYFSELQLVNETKDLKIKVTKLEQLVTKYSNDLALCKSESDTFLLAGKVGINITQPKNLIYAQAILNINMAWYIYLYSSNKIEYDKYNGVIEYVKEKGKTESYNELIAILDEKYKDIEENINNSS